MNQILIIFTIALIQLSALQSPALANSKEVTVHYQDESGKMNDETVWDPILSVGEISSGTFVKRVSLQQEWVSYFTYFPELFVKSNLKKTALEIIDERAARIVCTRLNGKFNGYSIGRSYVEVSKNYMCYEDCWRGGKVRTELICK